MNKTPAKNGARVLFIINEFVLSILGFCLFSRAKNKTAQPYVAQGFSKG
jgi:hypothetical protein